MRQTNQPTTNQQTGNRKGRPTDPQADNRAKGPGGHNKKTQTNHKTKGAPGKR